MSARPVILISCHDKEARRERCMSCLLGGLYALTLILMAFLAVAPTQVWAQAEAVSGEAAYGYTEETGGEDTAGNNQDEKSDEVGAADVSEGDQEDDDQGELTSANRFVSLSLQEAYNIKFEVSPPDIDPRNMDSLFFTLWQYSLLQEAKRGFLTRPPTAAEMRDDGTVPRKRGIRELSLGGIVYQSADDWTVWLNGQRVGPNALPESVIDIDVNREYVQLKWFDSYTNLIFPLRLRPHERFNLDTRIFLPGDGNKLN